FRRERLELHRVLAGNLLERDAAVHPVAQLPRYGIHIELADHATAFATERDLRLDPPQREIVERLAGDLLPRAEQPPTDVVADDLCRPDEREPQREHREPRRRAPAGIEPDSRVPVHLSAIDPLCR